MAITVYSLFSTVSVIAMVLRSLRAQVKTPRAEPSNVSMGHAGGQLGLHWGCLLYTSDAADDTPCVDL
eukprot:7427758-Pyramimonas_sp.AAC.1